MLRHRPSRNLRRKGRMVAAAPQRELVLGFAREVLAFFAGVTLS